jgi:type IV pilus assembly protein PilB
MFSYFGGEMKIGESLIKARLLTLDELNQALNEQEQTHDRLGDIVLRKGYVSAEQMLLFLADYFKTTFIKLKEKYKDIKPEVIDTVPSELAQRFNAIPVKLENETLFVAISDPLNLVAIDTLRIRTGYKIHCLIATEDEIREAIEYCYFQLPRMNECVKDFVNLGEDKQAFDVEEDDSEKLRKGANDQPVIQYVRSLIVQAVNNRASDIILQPKQSRNDLRFRIDGVLYANDPPPRAMLPAIVTRIKILSGLDIAERRIPQDGRFKVKVGGGEVDVRTSTFPTIYGESVVMRLLDTSSPLLGINQLGLTPADLERYRDLVSRSYGLILVTGPTGSGKTTTLYTTLNELKSLERNMVTLEDPVEYRLPFIQQSQVNPDIGFNFARGLRSILRQDPDIIMVGEIRDRETAEIAINAALTGHLVFSTLHTNDTSGAAVRLINMGVEPFLITASLLGVLAQRLVRTICPECREPVEVSKVTLAKLCLNHGIKEFYHGRGCPKCYHSGYRGRKGIFELLVMNERIGRLILDRGMTDDIRKTAIESGMMTMRENAIEKLREGTTTPEEVLRVTQQSGDA